MKHIKKLASLLLALVMALSLSVTAFADESTTYSITINNSTAGHTYEAYQISPATWPPMKPGTRSCPTSSGVPASAKRARPRWVTLPQRRKR